MYECTSRRYAPMHNLWRIVITVQFICIGLLLIYILLLPKPVSHTFEAILAPGDYGNTTCPIQSIGVGTRTQSPQWNVTVNCSAAGATANLIYGLNFTGCGDVIGPLSCPVLAPFGAGARCYSFFESQDAICVDNEGRVVNMTIDETLPIALLTSPLNSTTLTGTVGHPALLPVGTAGTCGGNSVFWSEVKDAYGRVTSCSTYSTVPITTTNALAGPGLQWSGTQINLLPIPGLPNTTVVNCTGGQIPTFIYNSFGAVIFSACVGEIETAISNNTVVFLGTQYEVIITTTVNGSTTYYQFATPQPLATISTPTFAGLFINNFNSESFLSYVPAGFQVSGGLEIDGGGGTTSWRPSTVYPEVDFYSQGTYPASQPLIISGQAAGSAALFAASNTPTVVFSPGTSRATMILSSWNTDNSYISWDMTMGISFDVIDLAPVWYAAWLATTASTTGFAIYKESGTWNLIVGDGQAGVDGQMTIATLITATSTGVSINQLTVDGGLTVDGAFSGTTGVFSSTLNVNGAFSGTTGNFSGLLTGTSAVFTSDFIIEGSLTTTYAEFNNNVEILGHLILTNPLAVVFGGTGSGTTLVGGLPMVSTPGQQIIEDPLYVNSSNTITSSGYCDPLYWTYYYERNRNSVTVTLTPYVFDCVVAGGMASGTVEISNFLPTSLQPKSQATTISICQIDGISGVFCVGYLTSGGIQISAMNSAGSGAYSYDAMIAGATSGQTLFYQFSWTYLVD